MKQINLLPYDLQQKSLYRKLAVAGAMAACAGGLVAGILFFSVRTINTNFPAPSSCAASACPSAAATPAQTAESNVKTRITALNALSATEVSWPKAFDLAKSLAGKDLALTAYSFTADNAAPVFKMVGTAPNNVTFASYIQTLQGDKRVKNLKIDTYTYSPDKGTVTYALSLTLDPSLTRYNQ